MQPSAETTHTVHCGPSFLTLTASSVIHALWHRSNACIASAVTICCAFFLTRVCFLVAQVYDSAKVMLGFLPTGAEHAAAAPSTTGTAERAAAAAAITPDGSAASTPSHHHHHHQVSTVSMFWSLPWREYDDWRARPLEEWKETIVSLQPRAAGLMQHIRSHDDLTLATYSDVVMRRFVSCNIGEAAPHNLRVLGLECAHDDTCLLLVCWLYSVHRGQCACHQPSAWAGCQLGTC